MARKREKEKTQLEVDQSRPNTGRDAAGDHRLPDPHKQKRGCTKPGLVSKNDGGKELRATRRKLTVYLRRDSPPGTVDRRLTVLC